MSSRHRMHVLVLSTAIGATIAAASVHAQGYLQPGEVGSLRFRLGLVQPEGSSEAWDSLYEGFTGSPEDLEDLSIATDFRWMISRSSGLQFGFSYFDGDGSVEYTDWVAGDGTAIRHQKSLALWDLTALWVFRFGAGERVSPYLGVGGGFLWYELEEAGDFIDFGSEDLPIVNTWYGAEGTTYELLGVAGVDVHLSPWWSFLAEGRWREAEDDVGDDYAGYGTLDLSGWEFSAGFAFNF